ncbi:Fem1b [Symbiodinium natans]|uniref:Fem1b protein n=1 Tax=Symbiodinium natans TaxID=878477 RepID=A0A812SKV1_9DINO|nr:Fem1b [Symbiodinium natans]
MGSIKLCGLAITFLAEAARGPGWEASGLPAALAQEGVRRSCEYFGAKTGVGTLCRCPEGNVTNIRCGEQGVGAGLAEFQVTDGLDKPCKCDHPCYAFDKAFPKRGTPGSVCTCLFIKKGYKQQRLAVGACGAGWGAKEFPLAGASKGCSCKTPFDLGKIRPPSPVLVAALNFCAAAGNEYGNRIGRNFGKHIRETYQRHREGAADALDRLHLTPELCQAVVAGSFNNSQKMESPWLEDAAKLSEHDGSKGFGRLDPLVGSTLRHHLRQVCHDECTLIVEEVKGALQDVFFDEFAKGLSTEQSCADRVVRRVEAEVLGCCGRACGWSGRSCTSWPFLSQDNQAAWLAECCTEYNVLKNSSREMMCNSVLTQQDAELVSEHDLSVEGKDAAATYLGQDPRLLWTAEGAASDLGSKYHFLDPPPRAGHAVAEELLRQEPNIRQRGLANGWFVMESAETESSSPVATSFLTVAAAADCETGPLDMTRCSADFKRWQHEACVEGAGWQARKVSKGRGRRPGCKQSAAVHVATPQECLEADLNGFSKIVRGEERLAGEEEARYFEYNKGQDGPPIACYVVSENFPCNFEDVESEAWDLDKLVFVKPMPYK